MQKKNNKGVIALIIVLVLAAAALVIWQTNKRETQQGSKEITINGIPFTVVGVFEEKDPNNMSGMDRR